ncbi:DNA-binding response OmpR family regulator [Pararhizobium capsulatum DSM 1112]|uniref:DNA-binding response OmpR family regulator n=1 Tax=Pararhizobium capsulatum DSM 1112 TaxID=1121113 RepID=A0ABU0BUA5_9HYPH|nr:response regulator [Pararhizobium capsulatum]MDQ0320437.1 DNA-binding response OmpR family regulator [Pararhizobium capsulatum DSM 1112]
MATGVKRLLVVEDDMVDARFVIRAFTDIGTGLEIIHVTDADNATISLSDGQFDYVLLDINIPGTDGMELLRQIRNNEKTAVLPVIMLTSSMNPRDVYRSYASGANAYAIKPSSISGYREFAEGFSRFWLDVAVHPHTTRPH